MYSHIVCNVDAVSEGVVVHVCSMVRGNRYNFIPAITIYFSLSKYVMYICNI